MEGEGRGGGGGEGNRQREKGEGEGGRNGVLWASTFDLGRQTLRLLVGRVVLQLFLEAADLWGVQSNQRETVRGLQGGGAAHRLSLSAPSFPPLPTTFHPRPFTPASTPLSRLHQTPPPLPPNGRGFLSLRFHVTPPPLPLDE